MNINLITLAFSFILLPNFNLNAGLDIQKTVKLVEKYREKLAIITGILVSSFLPTPEMENILKIACSEREKRQIRITQIFSLNAANPNEQNILYNPNLIIINSDKSSFKSSNYLLSIIGLKAFFGIAVYLFFRN